MAPKKPSPRSATRRTVLSVTGALGIGAFVGLDRVSGARTLPATGPWPSFARDAANTGAAPDGSGLADPPYELKWVDYSAEGPMTRSGARSEGVPLVVGDRVYIAHSFGWVAYDAETGTKEVWVEYESPEKDLVSSSATPAVSEGVLVVPTDRGIFGFEAETGTKLWRTRSEWRGYTAPTIADGTVYLSTNTSDEYGPHRTENALLALDLATGEERWRVEIEIDESASIGVHDQGFGVVPAVADGTVYAPSHEGVYALDAATGDIEWVAEPALVERSTAAVADGLVFFYGANYPHDWHNLSCPPVPLDDMRDAIFALDAETGETRWTVEVGSRMTGNAPAVGDGTVFASTSAIDSDLEGFEGGFTGLLALDAETGDERWRYEPFLGEPRPKSGPSVADGRVYVGAATLWNRPTFGSPVPSDLLAFDAASGDLDLWFWDPSFNEGFGTPTVAEGTVYTGAAPHGLLAAVGSASDERTPPEVEIEPRAWTLYDCDGVSFVITFPDEADEERYGDRHVRRWDADGDGEFDSLSVPYTRTESSDTVEPGEHTVRLDLRTDDGFSVSASRTVEVAPCEERPSPVIDYEPTDPTEGEGVTFEGSVEGDGDGVEFRWYFDVYDTFFTGQDDPDATGREVTRTFDDAGRYVANLLVEDADGHVGRESVRVTVESDDC